MATTILGFSPQQAIIAAVAIIILLVVVVNYTAEGKLAYVWLQANAAWVIAAVCIIVMIMMLRERMNLPWAGARETIVESLKDGYLADYALEGLSVEKIYAQVPPLQAVRIEPQLGYLFIGNIRVATRKEAIMLTGIKGQAGKILQDFQIIPTDKQIKELRHKELDIESAITTMKKIGGMQKVAKEQIEEEA